MSTPAHIVIICTTSTYCECLHLLISLPYQHRTATLVSTPAHFIVSIFTTRTYCVSASSRVVTISTTHFHISVYTCSYFSLASLELIFIVIIHTCSCIVSVVISTAIRLSLHLIIVSLPLLRWFRLIVSTPAHFIVGIFYNS